MANISLMAQQKMSVQTVVDSSSTMVSRRAHLKRNLSYYISADVLNVRNGNQPKEYTRCNFGQKWFCFGKGTALTNCQQIYRRIIFLDENSAAMYFQ